MLNALRRGAKTIFAKLLIGLLVVSFGIWGISSFLHNSAGANEVARAGDTRITADEFARVYERYRNSISQRMGAAITPEQAVAMGLPSQVLSDLVRDALEADAAHALGADLSDDAIAERIRNNPSFAGPNGSFDRNQFNRLLASNRITERDFIALERRLALQEILVNGLVGGVRAPSPYLAAFNRYANQSREVTTFTLTDEALDVIPDPSDEELRAFYEAHKERFRSPERRALSLVTLSAEALADPGTVTDAEIRRAYEAPGAYGAPERRHVQQVPMTSLDAANEAATALNGGADVATVLAGIGRSFDDVDLGSVARTDLVDPAVADAAFGMDAPGAVATSGRFGPVLVRVSEILPAEKRPFEEVADEIRDTLATEAAARQVNEVFNAIEDAVAGGARASEVADRFGLPLRTIPSVARNGTNAEGEPVDVDAAVIAEAFNEAPGDDPARVDVGGATVWVQVDGVDPASDQPFDAVRDAVVADWTQTEKAARLAALADEAVAAVTAATSAIVTSAPFSRQTPPADLPPAVARAAFEGPAGFVTAVAGDGDERIVLAVTAVSEPAFFEGDPALREISRTLDQGVANAIVGDLVNGWQQKVGATVNQPVLNQIIGVRADRG